MRNLIKTSVSISVMALVLSACSSLPTSTSGQFYQGNSTTYGNDNIVRNDVVNQIKKIERLAYSCNKVDSVNPKVVSVKQVKGLNHVNEIWQVQACGKTHTYPVSLRESASGGVDFTVSFKKQ